MSYTISPQEVLSTHLPFIPKPISSYVSAAKKIECIPGRLNYVFIIDNEYVLRTRKIQLQGFDDIGSCANYHATINHLDAHGFSLHPSYLIFVSEPPAPHMREMEFLLYKKSSGTTLRDILSTASKQFQISMGKKVAKLLLDLHKIPADQCGFFSGQQFPSWFDLIQYWVNNQSRYIREKGLLTESEIKKVRSIFDLHRQTLLSVQPCTIHLDFSPANILVDKSNNITCILDWDNARGGDKAADVCYTHNHALNESCFAVFREAFLNTYVEAVPPKERDRFRLLYRLSSLFFTFKLLPVHEAHLSNTHENVKNLTRSLRTVLSSFY